MEIEHRTLKDKWSRDRTIHMLSSREMAMAIIAQENIVMYYTIINYNVSMVNLPFNAGRNKNHSTPAVK